MLFHNGIISLSNFDTNDRKGFLHMKKKLLPALIVTGLIILVVIIMGITALINKYTPTKKTEDLKEYFNISSDDEAALIVDNELSDYKAKIIDKKYTLITNLFTTH